MKKLLAPFTKGNFELKNHLVMAPMTRSRAIDNIPNELMATYYGSVLGKHLIRLIMCTSIRRGQRATQITP